MPNAAIPSFYLYGEPHQAVAPGFIHVERLDDRSRPNEWTIRPHAHADLVQLFIVEEGGGVMHAEDRQVPFAAPTALIVPAGVVHGFEWVNDSKGSVLTVARSFLDQLSVRHPTISAVFGTSRVLALDPDAAETMKSAMAVLLRELGWSATGHRLAVEAGLLTMLVAALRSMDPMTAAPPKRPGQSAAVVVRYRERIEGRFRLREGVAAHARAMGISESGLRAACIRVAGRSPAAMLDERAMIEARRVLLYTNLSVAEVAYTLGFADPAYFSRFFSRHAGTSPGSYRRGTAQV